MANIRGEFVVTNAAPRPQIKPEQILVRTEAVAINPSDTKMVGEFQTPSALLGTDYAGTVVEVGSNVASEIRITDCVCGAAHGMNALQPSAGAFSEFVASNGPVYLCLLSSMSTEEGASLSAGLCTGGLALWLLGLLWLDQPTLSPRKVLVYGGSTAMGTLTIQLLRL